MPLEIIEAEPRRAINQGVIMAAMIALLLIAAIAGMVMVSQNRAAGARVLASQDIPLEISRLMILMQRAESSQRGYLLTANEDYRDLYRDTLTRIDPALATFTELLKAEPDLRRELAKLLPVFQAKLAELNETITLFDAGRHSEALALVRSDEGKRYMDTIREGVAAIWNDARAESAREIDDWRGNGDWLFAVQILASILVLAVAVLSIVSSLRYTRVLEGSRQALKSTNESLEERVAARTAELQEANAEVQKFAYIVSHDLRSPLVNIMGFTAELEQLRGELRSLVPGEADELGVKPRDLEDIDRDYTEALGFIRQSTGRMDRLINAILKLARSGQRELHLELIDMNGLLAGIVGTLQHRLDESGAELTLDKLPDLTGDRLALEQIFSNLLDNALKYLDDARVGEIRVSGRREGRVVLIEVTDNGRGIDAHDQERIFELFRRAGKQDRPGEGIGLAHLRVLVRRLGGKITCRSELGKGSTFSVHLPIHGSISQ